MTRLIVAAVLCLVMLPTVASATGLPAPLQADYDIGKTCEDARWDLFRYDGLEAPWVGAKAFCRADGAIWLVEWACHPTTGQRGVRMAHPLPGGALLYRDLVSGVPVYREINGFAQALAGERCR